MTKGNQLYVGDRVRFSQEAVAPVIEGLKHYQHLDESHPLVKFLRSTDTFTVTEENGTDHCPNIYDDEGNCIGYGPRIEYRWVELEGVEFKLSLNSDWFEVVE